MENKHLKEIAKELRSIRIELQKMNAPKIMSDETEAAIALKEEMKNISVTVNNAKAGERVTI